MGIDLKAGGRRVGHNERTSPVSDNVYLKLLVKLYSFISRRADSKFAATIAKRLCMSRINKPPLSLSRLARYMKGKESKVAVIVGGVTNDVRLLELPNMTVCALKFTEAARRRIEQAGGECMTFDQLALKDPKGTNTVLLRGPKAARESVKHFGHRTSSNNPHTHDSVKPYVRSKGRKFEKARGRRRTNGFKI
jgi:large subunit ribosomal protein L18e